MGPAFAAVGAAIAALLQATVGSRYQILDAQLQPVLVLGVAVTLVYGFEEGMTWAFVGGLFVDFLGMRPMGSTPFGLLAVIAATELAAPLLARSRYAGTIAAVVVLTPAYVVVSDVLTGLLSPPTQSIHPTALIAAAIANGIVAALAAPLVVILKRRAELRERVIWWR